MLLLNLQKLLLDDGKHALFTGEDIEKVLDFCNDGIVFPFDFVLLHRSQLIETEFKDGIYLAISENILVTHDTGLTTDQDAQDLGCG